MIAKDSCFSCLKRQAQSLCNSLNEDKQTYIIQKIHHIIEAAKPQALTPPEIAIDIYQSIAQNIGLKDPFFTIKQESMQKAYQIMQSLLHTYPPPSIQHMNTNSIHKRLDWALRMAILGNIIDYGAQEDFNFENADFSFENIEFASFPIEAFIAKLSLAKSMLYLADNAGENIFDEVLIQSLKEIYPKLEIYYAVRQRPIINDLTLQDMHHPLAQSIKQYCTLLDSGVKSPGFIYKNANAKTQAIYKEADVIFAKGMGNFECLNMSQDERLFMLFKVKCDVVAKFCKVEKGTMMFIHNAHKRK